MSPNAKPFFTSTVDSHCTPHSLAPTHTAATMPSKSDQDVNTAYDKDNASSVTQSKPSCARDEIPTRNAAEQAAQAITVMAHYEGDMYEGSTTPGGESVDMALCADDVHEGSTTPGAESNPIVVPDDDSDDDSDEEPVVSVDSDLSDEEPDTEPEEDESEGDESEGDSDGRDEEEDSDAQPEEDLDGRDEEDTGASAMDVETPEANDNLSAIGACIDQHLPHLTHFPEVDAFAEKARGNRTNPGKAVKFLNRYARLLNDTHGTDIPYLGNLPSATRNKRSRSPTLGHPVACKGGPRRSTRQTAGSTSKYKSYHV